MTVVANAAGEACFVITAACRHSATTAGNGRSLVGASMRERIRVKRPYESSKKRWACAAAPIACSAFSTTTRPAPAFKSRRSSFGPATTSVLRPNPREVAEAYRVPIAGLDAPGIPKLFDIAQSDRPVLSVRILGQDIFAPTAALVFQFREVAIHGRDTRVAQYDQPLFAWR